MAVFGSYLYAGTYSLGCEIWRSPDGTVWKQVNNDGFGDSNNIVCYPMIVYDDLLYAGTVNVLTGCELWRYSESPTGICTSVRIYGEGSEEIELLKDVRDEILNTTPEGRELIKLYYQWSPMVVKAMKEDEEFKKEMKEMIDGILPLIK